MRKPITQRIKELEERKRVLQSRLDRQERARVTRRKIVLGSFLLERLEQGGDTNVHNDLMQWLRRELPAFLSRDADRALFADLLEECRMGHGNSVANVKAQQSSANRREADTSHADVTQDDGR